MCDCIPKRDENHLRPLHMEVHPSFDWAPHGLVTLACVVLTLARFFIAPPKKNLRRGTITREEIRVIALSIPSRSSIPPPPPEEEFNDGHLTGCRSPPWGVCSQRAARTKNSKSVLFKSESLPDKASKGLTLRKCSSSK